MNALWSYFWPLLAAGLVIGAIAGSFGFRRRGRSAKALAAGIAASIAAAALWHGPLGAADRFTARVERGARQALDYYEMTKVTAHLHRAPLTRTLILRGRPTISGPASWRGCWISCPGSAARAGPTGPAARR